MPPRSQEWIVQVVDQHQDACALFNRNVLRVHRDWQTAVYDAGLHSLGAYHPLSLKKVGSEILRGLSSRMVVDVWEACTLKKGYKGRVSEKRGFIARTEAGGVGFGQSAGAAELEALRDARRAIYQRTRLARLRALRDENYQGLMSRRLALRKYDGAFRVRLADYERWLPKHTTQAFKHYGEQGVPLLVIEGEAFDLVPSLDDRQLADLFYQLDRDVLRAQTETDDRSVDQFLERLADLDAGLE
ncbi:hypothetical protein BST65_17270 [Bradyrhizobium canariense]|nr:hypothetical protein BST65_17270 [Bradyrhizobium canariense]OSI53334.1 hypothetical protein BSZ20_03260 [Bradyrhizobium canariense]